MRFISVFLLASAFVLASGDKLGDALKYLDEVLSVYVPWSVEAAGLNLYEMPNFSHNFQNRSADGGALNTKVIYHSGNLTGLGTVLRRSCNEPSWASGNISVVCSIGLPVIEVKYQVRFQEATGHTSYFRLRQYDYGATLDLVDTEASIEVTSSPHIKVPTIKHLNLISMGKPSISFHIDKDISYEVISAHFYHKVSNLFQDLFIGPYKKALERAVASVPYPERT